MPTDRLARPAAASRPSVDTRVLLVAPTARDGAVSARLLADAGVACTLCGDPGRVCDEATGGAGAVVLPEELVLNGGTDCLAEFLRRQPVWSDLPVIVLAGTDTDPAAVDRAIATLGNVTVVERPLRVSTLLSAVRTALRARERQYQIRDHLLAQQWSAAALRASDERLALAVGAAELGTFYCPMPLGRLEWNATCKAHFWLSPEAEVDIDRFYRVIHPDDRDRVRAAVDAAVVGRQPYDVEYRTVSPDGRVRWVRAKGRAYHDADGRPTRFDGITVDVTDQKRAEAELRDARRRLEATLSAGEVATWVWDVVADRIVADRNLAHLFGATGAEAVGGPIAAYVAAIHPDDRGRVSDQIAAALATPGAPFRSEYRVVRPDGTVRTVLVRGKIERDADGRPVRLPGVTLDITDRVEAERAEQRLAKELARQSRELARQTQVFDAVLSSMADPAYILDRDGRFRFANRPLLALWDRTAEQAQGRSFAELGYPPDLIDQLMVDLRTVFATRRPVSGEAEYTGPRGVTARYEHVFAPVFAPDGSVELIAGTSRDVTARAELDAAREHALAAERAARAEAERQGQMKDEFLATLSHELRTPLNAILGWTQILRSDGPQPEPDDLAEGLATIERNARAQTQIIEDLLDMSRVISGKMHLDARPVDLPAVVRDAADTVRPAADAKSVGLAVDVTGDPAGPVNGDPHRLGQVFWNLFSNAVKFTPRGGRVTATVSWDGSAVRVGIRDTGEGIRPEFLPFVFDRFRQADASSTRKHGGLGLGLAIVKQLVELHGGRVRVDSEGLGRGATFTVELPVAADAVRAAADGADADGAKTGPAVAAGPDARPLPDVAAVHPRRSLAGVRVLAVDDEPDARGVLRRFLEDAGAEVRMAGSAAEALALLSDGVPDVLVSDIGMPGEDGHALIARIRRRPPDAGGTVPAVALTAYARPSDRAKAMAAGFDAHLVKPVTPAALLATVADLVAARRPAGAPAPAL